MKFLELSYYQNLELYLTIFKAGNLPAFLLLQSSVSNNLFLISPAASHKFFPWEEKKYCFLDLNHFQKVNVALNIFIFRGNNLDALQIYIRQKNCKDS